MKRFKYLLIITMLGISLFNFSGCTMLYHERSKVLIPNVDVDQTLEVAELEIQENKVSSVLTLWAMRDQIITPKQARRVSALYFEHILRVDSEAQKARGFSVWHLTWAISNMYRLGDDAVKAELNEAYVDAAVRVDTLDSKIATAHFYGDEIVMGDAHFGGRAYAKGHIVAPGNEDYLQSAEEFKRSKELN